MTIKKYSYRMYVYMLLCIYIMTGGSNKQAQGTKTHLVNALFTYEVTIT